MIDTEQIMQELSRQGDRLSNIETAIQSIAVQDNKIIHLQEQVHDLYRKSEVMNSPDGILAKVQNWQASCPRSQFPRMWWAIGLIATLEVCVLTALFQVISKMGGG